MHPLEAYLRDLRDIKATGAAVAETSYYGPLATLLNEAGRRVHPRVLCVINTRNQGAGLPDGGFFTRNQLKGDPADEMLHGQLPARGAMEVKGTGEDVAAVAVSAQVREKYWPRYGQVLVTNLRDFQLVGADDEGSFALLSRFSLAPSEQEFWTQTSKPRDVAHALGDPLLEYLMRVLMQPAPLRNPADVAWYLASYAREAAARISVADTSLLADVRTAMEEALGLRFEGEKGEHFFRSTLVQTLFYGIFSAWVLWCKSERSSDKERFDWRLTMWSLHVPMVAALYSQLSSPARLGALGVVDLLRWTGETLNRVDREEFFKKFDEGKAVQYFYEPFLEAFDPALRKELGVWYTPPEIVEYITARVDRVLREELEMPDGLADPRVVVLDPCTGTGSFPVAVLRTIERTLRAKGDDALVAVELKQAAMHRVFGFEILPAPFVVAHLQIGLMLQTHGAPLESSERAGVYLTNSLTGWETPDEKIQHALFPELADERDLAEEVKRDKPVIVIMGNPPYNAFAGVSPKEEGGLVEPYKAGLRDTWGMKKFNLDELYIRFFRLAERRIAERTGKGVVSYISNFSYLDEPSFVVMRESLFGNFDAMWFDSLNGDSRRNGKRTPEGKPDPSVFSTPSNPQGIRVGTAVSVLVKQGRARTTPTRVYFRQFWGLAKRADLLASLDGLDTNTDYEAVEPKADDRFSFIPTNVSAEYRSWPKLQEFGLEAPYQGLGEDRRKSLIDIDRPRLEDRMRLYFDKSVTWDELRRGGGPLVDSYTDFKAEEVRLRVLRTEVFEPAQVRRFTTRPFDIQWCYYSPTRPIWRRNRPEFVRQAWDGNGFLLSRFNSSADEEGAVLAFTESLCDYHALSAMAVAFPMMLRESTGARDTGQAALFPEAGTIDNSSIATKRYLDGIGWTPDQVRTGWPPIWMHALAIGSSPAYLRENRAGLRRDMPRIPVPSSSALLAASAILGRNVAALLSPDEEVDGVTSGTVGRGFRKIAMPSRVEGGQLNPAMGDLDVTAGWGYLTSDRKVMPGSGRHEERTYTPEELADIEAQATAEGRNLDDYLDCLGRVTVDVFLNGRAYWSNVPEKVWSYAITGDQVLKKWLSYRDRGVLGRSLDATETRYFASVCRRIAALLLAGPALDLNYSAVKATTWDWVP